MTRHTVLVVDDDVIVREMLYDVLTHSGYEVWRAEHGLAALTLLGERQPDLVLLDIAMPELDGIETLRRIRSLHPALPVVMLTAYGDVETASRALRHGAADYVPKPFNVEYLERVVVSQLAARESAAGPPVGPTPRPDPGDRGRMAE